MMELASTMNSFALGMAGCVSLGLAAHRLRWGDDHGHYPDLPLQPVGRRNRFERVPRKKAGRKPSTGEGNIGGIEASRGGDHDEGGHGAASVEEEEQEAEAKVTLSMV